MNFGKQNNIVMSYLYQGYQWHKAHSKKLGAHRIHYSRHDPMRRNRGRTTIKTSHQGLAW